MLILVAVLIVPSVLGYVLFTGLGVNPGGPSVNTPIGAAFQIGDPVGGSCPSGNAFDANGCEGPGHFYYRIAIEASTIALGDVSFSINAASGAIDTSPGALGFTVLNASGKVDAQYSTSGGPMSMAAGWMVYGAGDAANIPITTTDTILIDIGTTNPTGEGLELLGVGTGYYSGTVAVALP